MIKDDHGSAALETAMAAPVLMLVVLGILQFGLWYHARQVVVGAAQEGARVAAAEGATAEAGEERALIVLRSGLGALPQGSTAAATIAPESVSVSVKASLRGLLPIPGLNEFRLDATVSSYREGFRAAGND